MSDDRDTTPRRRGAALAVLGVIVLGAAMLVAAAVLVDPIAGLAVAGALVLAAGLDLARGGRS